jgi:opacity protein-like surface antigen
MNRIRNYRHCAIAMVLSLLATAAVANPLGFYIGAAVGQARAHGKLNLNEIVGGVSSPFAFASHATGWKAIVGLRPISLLGAEAEYIDFGAAKGTAGLASTTVVGGFNGAASAQPRALAVFGLLYLPMPLPLLDVYGKAGVATFKPGLKAAVQSLCPSGVQCTAPPGIAYDYNRNSQELALGAGVQLKFAGLAVRGEYERISAAKGDPDLLSLGLTWSF